MSCKLPFYITEKCELKSKGTGAYMVALSEWTSLVPHGPVSFCSESIVQQVLNGAQSEILTN
jgi:hypothetical protein